MGVDILEHPLEIYVTISKIAPDTDKPPVMSTGESEIFGKGLKSMRNGTTILTTVRYSTVQYSTERYGTVRGNCALPGRTEYLIRDG